MVRYGGNLTGFNALNYLCRNADNVLIGRFIGAAALGIYAKAYQLLVLPINQIGAPIAGVALPALSRLQNDTARWRQYYLNSILFLTAFTMPVVVFTFVCADAVVGTLLGPGWGNAVLIYRLLAGAAFVDTFNVASGWAFMTLGQTGRQFRWQFIESAVTLAGFVIGLHWGAAGVAAGFSIARVTMRFPQLAYCYRTAPVSVGDLLRVLRRPATYALLAGAAVAVAQFTGVLAGPAVIRLVLGGALFGGLYAGLWLASADGRRLALAGWTLLSDRGGSERTTSGAGTIGGFAQGQ
jgi:PST family polysaccharide transporter